MFCLESRSEMPALPEEIEEAQSEGITINNSWGPKRIIVENGKVTGVEFKKCVSVFDENKRFSPKYDENQTQTVKADHVLVTVGQGIDWGNMLADSKVELNPNKTVKADPTTFQTGEPDIFAGGDALSGPKFAIDAIAAGKEGAISIHRFVQPGQSLTMGRLKRDYVSFDKTNVDLDSYDRLPRQKACDEAGHACKESFKDPRGTLTEDQIRKETERCLSCGATIVDEDLCVGCGQCTTKCKFDAITLVKKYDAENVDFSELKPHIIKSVLKRKLKIAVKKPFRAIGALFSKK